MKPARRQVLARLPYEDKLRRVAELIEISTRLRSTRVKEEQSETTKITPKGHES